MTIPSSGAKFRQALKDEKPLQIIGAINANHAHLAKRAGYRAIYLSGGGVAAGSPWLPRSRPNNLGDLLTQTPPLPHRFERPPRRGMRTCRLPSGLSFHA